MVRIPRGLPPILPHHDLPRTLPCALCGPRRSTSEVERNLAHLLLLSDLAERQGHPRATLDAWVAAQALTSYAAPPLYTQINALRREIMQHFERHRDRPVRRHWRESHKLAISAPSTRSLSWRRIQISYDMHYSNEAIGFTAPITLVRDLTRAVNSQVSLLDTLCSPHVGCISTALLNGHRRT